MILRPYHRSDAQAWSTSRWANEEWLAKWEPTPPRGSWAELNSVASFRLVHRELRRVGAGRDRDAVRDLPAEDDGSERLVGQITLGNIVRRAFCSAYAGYWVDSRVAGRGIIPTALALAVDHGFSAGGLHRVEVNIRPENRASRRVVEKLGFREEAYHAAVPAHRRRLARPCRVRVDRGGRGRRGWTARAVASPAWQNGRQGVVCSYPFWLRFRRAGRLLSFLVLSPRKGLGCRPRYSSPSWRLPVCWLSHLR